MRCEEGGWAGDAAHVGGLLLLGEAKVGDLQREVNDSSVVFVSCYCCIGAHAC